jgi:hypothetical protein
MKKSLRSVLGAAQRLEASITTRIEGGGRAAAPDGRQPIEILHAVVDEVAREIQPVGRGQHAFPFNQIHVAMIARSPRARTRLEAACGAPPSLTTRIVERLSLAGCATSNLTVEIEFVEARRSDWSHADFDVRCARVDAGPVQSPAPLSLELSVLQGTTPLPSYRLF